METVIFVGAIFVLLVGLLVAYLGHRQEKRASADLRRQDSLDQYRAVRVPQAFKRV